MKQVCFLFLSVILFIGTSFAQQVGTWKVHFSYNKVDYLIQSKKKVYALGNGVLFSVDKESETIETLTKVTGLSDGYISNIAYNEELDAVIIGYDNSNVDIIKGKKIINIPDLKLKEIGGKQINSISTHGRFAYLSCGLGIVVVDMKKNEFADTYYIMGKDSSFVSVYQVEVIDDDIYALTEDGLFVATARDVNLSDCSNWHQRYCSNNELIDPIGMDSAMYEDMLRNQVAVSSITQYNNQLILVDKDSVYVVSAKHLYPIQAIHDLKSVVACGESLVLTIGDSIYRYDSSFSLKDMIPTEYCKYAIYTSEKESYWIARAGDFASNVYEVYNLFKYSMNGNLKKFAPIGPRSHSVSFVKYQYGKLVTGSGGRFDIPIKHYPGVLQILENGEWTVITKLDFTEGENLHENSDFVEVLDAAVDPSDHKRIYVASWRSLFEIYDKKPVHQYWYDESAIQTYNGTLTLVDGLCFDKDNNLWFANMFSPNGLVVKKSDGTWDSFQYSALDNIETIKEVFISENGLFWVIRPRKNDNGFLVIDQNKTPFDSSDDRSKYYSSFTDTDGNTLVTNAFRCIAEDKNHTIWLGTSAGPLIVNNTKKIFDNDFTFSRIKITREDNENYADYLLGSDQINAIIVDGGNRKWIGSATSGVYLLSPDGKETIEHFTTENSPLTSNAIIDMAMNQETGELFIAASNGLFSYMTNSSEGSRDYSNVYAYPNPVTPDYEGDIVVKGLVENSIVRVADVEGNVVYEDYSQGGTFTWNGKYKSGDRAATGIYYVFAALEDGSMKVVTKIAFIH